MCPMLKCLGSPLRKQRSRAANAAECDFIAAGLQVSSTHMQASLAGVFPKGKLLLTENDLGFNLSQLELWWGFLFAIPLSEFIIK